MKKSLIPIIIAAVAIIIIFAVLLTKAGKDDSDSTTAVTTVSSETVTEAETKAETVPESETEKPTEETTEEKTKFSDKIAAIFEKTTAVLTTQQSTPSAVKIEDYEYAYAGFQPAYANVDIDDWKMLLVNRDYILPDDYEVKLAPCITDDPDSLKLDYRVAPHYNEMYLAALEDGVELTPISGYRSVERQERNFRNKIQKYVDEGYSKTEATQMAATIILPPGTSEHNAGLAMDICSLYESFEKTEEFEWLSENAADYGFILRYPEDKQDITKIIYEPWHWRYVGVEAAKEMKSSGQCFEEYLGVANN